VAPKGDVLLNLVLTVVGLTAFMHLMKLAQVRGQRVFAVGFVNYVVAAVVSTVLYLACGRGQFSWLAALLGAAVGGSYVLTFVLLTFGISGSGVSLTTVISRLSIIIPIVASIVFWDNMPPPSQIAGVLMILVALPLIGIKPASNPGGARPPSLWVLALIFVISGATAVAMKYVSHLGPVYAFNMALFTGAAIVSAGVTFFVREAPRPREAVTGTMLGASNVLANLPILLALQAQTGTTVFSTRTSAAVVVTVLTSMWVWHERLSRRTMIGIGVAAIALILVTLNHAK
jgi:drug/metabolite transporter (DMT)-like permease